MADIVRVPLSGLPSAAFQHPLDRAATENLERIPGFQKLVSVFIEYGFERLQYVHNMGESIRVSERQMPKLLGLLREACGVLSVDEPELYVQQGDVNAYTAGHRNPYIVLQTGLIDLFDEDEIMAVLAHELGHIKCGHVLYKQMARLLVPFLAAIPGIGGFVGLGVESAFLIWDRRSELSADRASLLSVQDARVCNVMFMKLAGGTARFANDLNLEEFLSQARRYRDDADEETKLDKVYRFMAGVRATHPFAVERCHALLGFQESPEYQRILGGAYAPVPTAPPQAEEARCARCSALLSPGRPFCSACGTPRPSIAEPTERTTTFQDAKRLVRDQIPNLKIGGFWKK